jgi:phage tail sheath gpL-like
LARAINASSTALISSQVTATSSGAVVTLASEQTGLTGNDTTLVSSDGATLAVTGSGRLTGGTETVVTF